MWCHGSGVVLDCIVSCSLPPSLLTYVFASVPTNLADVCYTGITKDDWGNIKQYIWVQPQQILTQVFKAIKGKQYSCSF